MKGLQHLCIGLSVCVCLLVSVSVHWCWERESRRERRIERKRASESVCVGEACSHLRHRAPFPVMCVKGLRGVWFLSIKEEEAPSL